MARRKTTVVVALEAALLLLAGIGQARGAVSPPWDPFFAPPAVITDFGAASRPFGIAAGDFDSDFTVDLVVGRVSGNVAFLKGNGDGTFAPPVTFGWKQAFFNAWALAAEDVNDDGKLDVIWGANATSQGVSPDGTTISVNDGEVRVWYGNGDGTFAESAYFVSGVRHNAGSLLADIGTDAGSVAAADIDRDADIDIVAGAIDGSSTVIKLLRNSGGGSFTVEMLISQPISTALSSPVYFPATSTQNSPWGVSLSDADGDGDVDLWVGDRALYVYLFENDGGGSFTLQTPNSAVPTRPNVYLGHDAFRAAVGFTPSLGSGDLNGDGRADLALGLHSGTQTPATNVAHDGLVLLDTSRASDHGGLGPVADVGTMARGVTVLDANGDGYLDIVAAEHSGKVTLLRQLPPRDDDGDGVSDYVDNAVSTANAPRLDINTDGAITFRDQLDNDFDTVLGNPEDPSTWTRLGDPDDPDDDNDGAPDDVDNCPTVANASRIDADGDSVGDACDPLDNRDTDGDGTPDGPFPGDPLYEAARAAKLKWSKGTTHFVIRIDALSRFFQNEFTQLMTDAATLSADDWAVKCWENYRAGDPDDPPDPCGVDEGLATQSLTLPGGKEVPVTVVVIPKQLWTDPPVITWINDRNDNPRFELGQHGTYHANNVPQSDWKDLADRNFFSCEVCGLSEAEAFGLMKVGRDTLLGNYGNKWIAESGATSISPKVEWETSAHALMSYAPPFNTSDTTGRKAIAQLGFRAFSASVFEEGGFPGFSEIFTPEGSHHEAFDQFGMFHASADVELEPPETPGDTYDAEAYEAYLHSETNAGGLTTWLIEEVEWSGRPCNNESRLGTCNGGSNRENNTVYLPRWQAWMQVLDFVKRYPGGVVMTMGEVALARAYDNAPTVPNPDQADSDHNGIGDVVDGASIEAPTLTLSRNAAGSLRAVLRNGAGSPIAGQTLTFTFDADGNGALEVYAGTTGGDGVATASVTVRRPVGRATFAVAWNGGTASASAEGTVLVVDATRLALDSSNPTAGQVTDAVTVGATLTDSDGAPLAGRAVGLTIGSASAEATTGSDGHAAATLVLQGPVGPTTLRAEFVGEPSYGRSSAVAAFVVESEDTRLAMPDAIAIRNEPARAGATLTEADGAPLPARRIAFYVLAVNGGQLAYTLFGTSLTNASGVASVVVPNRHLFQPIRAIFDGDPLFRGSSADAFAYRLPQ